jgi:hypothetical protein
MTSPRPRLSREALVRLAADFWGEDSLARTFPRDLELALSLKSPVWVERIEGLSSGHIRDWLSRRRLHLRLKMTDRALNGCVVAYCGNAAIFLEAGLAAEEARVILAHEYGHYLAEYDWPRRRILDRLGPSVLPILDGERGARAPEKWAALLAGVHLGGHVHFMERAFDPQAVSAHDNAERTANELGCELLAPVAWVLAEGRARGLNEEPGEWRELLREQYGFPRPWGEAYAARLLGLRARGRTFTDILGF